MKKLPALLLLTTCSLLAIQVQAAISADEAKALGTTLTPFGAQKEGNAEGTIAPYDPTRYANIKVTDGPWGDRTELKDPFADEKPILRIDANNMAQYKDKLSEGQMKLLESRPGYYLNIFPSHRTAVYPDELLKKTVANATGCKTLDNGDAIDEGCRGGLPFPIPKTGKEVMWNHLAGWQGPAVQIDSGSFLMTSAGNRVVANGLTMYRDYPYYTPSAPTPQIIMRTRGALKEPARQSGVVYLFWDYLNPTQVGNPRSAWSYSPGQRRVRSSPDQAYDTPSTGGGGQLLSDEAFLYSGKMDRWDMKIVAKKEMYIPYNSFGMNSYRCDLDTSLKPNFLNPECERWELHRVWEIEATLKPGMRHVHSKRRYYLDEDDYLAGFYEAWDQGGKLARAGFTRSLHIPEHKIGYVSLIVFYDFNVLGYFVGTTPTSKKATQLYGQMLPERNLTPEAMQGTGVR